MPETFLQREFGQAPNGAKPAMTRFRLAKRHGVFVEGFLVGPVVLTASAEALKKVGATGPEKRVEKNRGVLSSAAHPTHVSVSSPEFGSPAASRIARDIVPSIVPQIGGFFQSWAWPETGTNTSFRRKIPGTVGGS